MVAPNDYFHQLIRLSLSSLVVQSIKWQKMVTTAHHNILKAKAMSSTCSFCPTNNPKPKDARVTIT